MVLLVDDTQHDGQEGHAEDVVAVREETGTSDQNGAHMVPAEGGLVDLGKSKASALIGIFDMLQLISILARVDAHVGGYEQQSHWKEQLARAGFPRGSDGSNELVEVVEGGITASRLCSHFEVLANAYTGLAEAWFREGR